MTDPFLIKKHKTQIAAMLAKLGLPASTPVQVRFATYHDAAHNPWVILVEPYDVTLAQRLWTGKPDPNQIGPWGDRLAACITPA